MSYRLDLGERVFREGTALDGVGAGDPIFTIAGGPILMTFMLGHVVGGPLDGTVVSISVQHTDTDAAPATQDLCAALVCTSDPEDTLYFFNTLRTEVLIALDGVGAYAAQAQYCGGALAGVGVLGNGIVCGVGTISILSTAADDGLVQWTMFYIPMGEGISVTMVP